MAHRWYQWEFGGVIVPVEWTAITAIYFAALVSVISAVDYFIGFWKKIDHAAADRRKSFVMTRKGGRSVSPAE
jgi:CDP-diacylglycerol--glycerol-3-phosphate 3-phosphatidyltransferase